MIHIACFPEELILAVVYKLTPNHTLQTVNINRLMPTQPELNPVALNYYRLRHRMVDAEGSLPYGLCFADSNTIYITNGHHRWYVCLEKGRLRLRMWVHDHPLTLIDALRAVLYPPRPVSKSHRPTQRPSTPQQLKFTWQ